MHSGKRKRKNKKGVSVEKKASEELERDQNLRGGGKRKAFHFQTWGGRGVPNVGEGVGNWGNSRYRKLGGVTKNWQEEHGQCEGQCATLPKREKGNHFSQKEKIHRRMGTAFTVGKKKKNNFTTTGAIEP